LWTQTSWHPRGRSWSDGVEITAKKQSSESLANGKNPFARKSFLGERVIVLSLFIAASLAIVISGLIVYTLVDGSIDFFGNPAVDIIDFFTGTLWRPNGTEPSFGLLALLSGTILIAGGTLLIAGPLGVGAAIYLSEFAGPRFRSIAKPVVELLAGIPSIVYGFFALLVISPIFQDYFGASYFNAASAIVVMSVMVLPIIISVSDDAMKAIPRNLREASLSMGATKWETATKVVMPAASSGIMASVLLGLARAIGETMIVVLVAGSVAGFSLNIFGETQTMTSYIAQVATGDIPPGVAVSAAFAVGLVLFVITYMINSLASKVVDRIRRGSAPKSAGGKIEKALRKFAARFSLRSRPRDSESYLRLRQLKGRIGSQSMALCILLAGAFLIILLTSVFIQGIGVIDLTFLTEFPSSSPERAGIYPVIIGSIYLMGLTMLFAIPVGVGAATYLNEFARDTRFTRLLRRIIQNLAGVPSIVFGLVGLYIFSRMFGFGASLLSGALTLAIMSLPVIVVTTEEALRAVPMTFREAAKGLGATKWQTVRHHVLPNAVPGIMTGTILSLSRAIGETAPILFIAAVFEKTAPSGIMDGFMALPVTIFYWTRHPNSEFHDLAAGTILVLLAMLLSMNALAIYIRHRAQKRRDW
jgi:phosphate ABC transporter permease subunit PstA/phosphate ABC transporter permease protein PstC